MDLRRPTRSLRSLVRRARPPLHPPDPAPARRRPPPAPDRRPGPQALGRRHRGALDRRLRLARRTRRRHHARLEVSPDVVLDLPPPGEDAAGATLTPRPRPTRAPQAARPAPRTAEAGGGSAARRAQAHAPPAAVGRAGAAPPPEPAAPPAATEPTAEPPARPTLSSPRPPRRRPPNPRHLRMRPCPLPEFEPPAAAPRETDRHRPPRRPPPGRARLTARAPRPTTSSSSRRCR